MKLELICYGRTRFEINRFEAIKNREGFAKPKGGLWASPIDSNYGWRDWCFDNDFHVDRLDSYFTFQLCGNVFVIDGMHDALKLPWLGNDRFFRYPDFEHILNIGYDAVYLTLLGEEETRFGEPSFYGWDCESVLVMNPKAIIL